MTSPCRTDPALDVVAAATASLLDWFNPDSECPAKVGTTTAVRFFAGDGAPLAAVDLHTAQSGCNEPFVWVRMMRRYRARQFPTATIATDCALPRVVAVELGIGWCAVLGPDETRPPTWEEYVTEAAVSADTAWRIEEALCQTSGRLKRDNAQRAVGTDTIVPYGPEGGVIAWTGVLYATY